MNEATHINELLFHLLKNTHDPNLVEIIVVDGGSTDNTAIIVESIDGVLLIRSKKGRGRQMNYGAKQAKGAILYFLHADSFPPKNYDQYIRAEFLKNNKAGCFKMSFDSKHPWLQLAGWFTQFNIKFFRGGDQSLFIENKLFTTLGGYPENHPIFEDFILIRTLYKHHYFTVIQKSIVSSSRRYQENGITKLQYHYWIIYIKKWLGTPTEVLVSYYQKHIK